MEILPFSLAKELATQLISLAVALLGLTLTFVKDFDPKNLRILVSGWIALLTSVISGVLHFMALTGQAAELAQHKTTFTGFADSVFIFARAQVFLFGLGICLLLFFGLRQQALALRQKETSPSGKDSINFGRSIDT